MAKLDIYVSQNEYDLWDYSIEVNDQPWGVGDNYRTEELAIQAAKESYRDRNN